MARVRIAKAYKPVEIDLWDGDGGGLFETIDVPRSLAKKAEKVLERLIDADNADDEVKLTGELLDVKLAAKNGCELKPSEILKAKWEGDELTLRQLYAFTDALGDAERPTGSS